jgi:hypothetical protein
MYAVESATYRLADDLEQAFRAEGTDRQQVWRAAAAEYAAECALIKVAATEALHQIVDDALQIHGGYGYSEEYPIAALYRDTRVNRIYEGTNEINRLNLVERLEYALRKGCGRPNRQARLQPTRWRRRYRPCAGCAATRCAGWHRTQSRPSRLWSRSPTR